ncbi:MAG TPA: cytidylate kinase-like family protein [Solirubrobacteraceae bacterium]|nr:cytidylate kinase-like family protein [Solirubrobacteraceae bacterium]
MAYKVVCISAADGAMGEEIGPQVAGELGFRLVSDQIVVRAADEAGVQAHVVADVEQRGSMVDRVIGQLFGRAAAADVAYGFGAPVVVDPEPPGDNLRGLIRTVIEEIASSGDAVIVSHAASHALANRADTLRVLITAGPDTRAARLRTARKVSEKEAQKLVARGDKNRADYIKRFYEVSAELPTHYDIVLNSDRLSPDQAADIIVRTASADPASAPISEAPARHIS